MKVWVIIVIIAKASEPISARLKLRFICIPRIQATITQMGTTKMLIPVIEPKEALKEMSVVRSLG